MLDGYEKLISHGGKGSTARSRRIWRSAAWALGVLAVVCGLLGLAHVVLPGEASAAPQVNNVVVYTDQLADGWVHIAIWSLGSEDPANWAVLAQGCRLDMSGDGEFRVNDIQAVAAAWGGVAGDLVYRAHLDLDADGDVDATDVLQAAAGWRVGCQKEHIR
jgi:hypothetical protein